MGGDSDGPEIAYEKEIDLFLKTIRVENQSGNLSKLLRKINQMKNK